MIDSQTFNMSVSHQQCIQVSCRGINRSITNFNHMTTVADIINSLLDYLSETDYFTINDCCLYIDQSPYLLPLKSTDFIEDILCGYSSSSSNIHFQLAFKRRHSSPSRFARRKKLLRTSGRQSTVINPYEHLKIQEFFIQKQQELIHQLTKINDKNRFVDKEMFSSLNTRQSRHDVYDQAVNQGESNRSFSQVRFRLSTITRKHEGPSPSTVEVKSILKKLPMHRSSSVDRDIDQLISLKPGEHSFCTSDDDNSSEQSTTDSCLGSLSSIESVSHCYSLETLV